MKARIAIPFFSGTNCHLETIHAIECSGAQADLVFYQQIRSGEVSLLDYSGIWLAGGFAFGDHFNSGRIAGLILQEHLQEFAKTARPIVGICNGKQILFEAGLFNNGDQLGGALVRNACGHFVSCDIDIVVEDTGTPWTEGIEGAILHLPVAHGEGRWLRPESGAPHLTPAFRYVLNGKPTQTFPHNPSGSPGRVAGFVFDNVCGMMPHPERAAREELGYAPGLLIVRNFVRYAAA